MDREFDKKIKELLVSNEELEVQEMISQDIDRVLKEVNTKKKNKGMFKKGAIAACIILTSMIGFGVAFPAVADNIPVINKFLGNNSIFNNGNENEYNHFDNLRSVQNISVGINREVKSNDISINIKEVAYDGVALYLIYDIKADKNIEVYDDIKTVSINGKTYEPGVGIPETLDNNTIQYTDVYPITNHKEIPNKFTLSINFTEIGGREGNWDFELPLDKKEMVKNLDEAQVNKKFKIGSDKIEILSISETSSYVTLSVEHSNYQPDNFYFSIFDEDGNELKQLDIGRLEEGIFKTKATRYYKRVNDNEISKISIIRRKVPYNSPEKIKQKVYIKVNETLPKTISIGENKKLNILSFKERDDNYEFTVSSKDTSLVMYWIAGGISVYNREKNNENESTYEGVELDSSLDNTFKVIVYKSNTILQAGKDAIAFGNYDDTIEELYQINISKEK